MSKTLTVDKFFYKTMKLSSFGNAGPNPCISGMKEKYWGKDAYCLKCGAYVYNVDVNTYEKAKKYLQGFRLLADGKNLCDKMEEAYSEIWNKAQKQPSPEDYMFAYLEENQIWTIQDWVSSMGDLTEAEYAYLEKAWNFSQAEIDSLFE